MKKHTKKLRNSQSEKLPRPNLYLLAFEISSVLQRPLLLVWYSNLKIKYHKLVFGTKGQGRDVVHAETKDHEIHKAEARIVHD